MPETKFSLEALIHQLYLGILKREPTEAELSSGLSCLKTSPNDLSPLIQHLLNSIEFSLIKKPHPELDLQRAYRTLLPQTQIAFLPETLGVGNPKIIWDKPLVFFMHIPKTGGTTLRYWLCQHFHPLQIHKKPAGRQVKLDPSTTRYKLITGHTDILDYEILPCPKKIITVFREPKKRIYSHYHFLKIRSWLTSKDNAATHHPNLKDFLISPAAKKNLYDNLYLRTLTGSWVTHFATDPLEKNPKKLLHLAKKNLEKIHAVGILEKLPESMQLFSKLLNFGDFDTSNDIQAFNILAEREKTEKGEYQQTKYEDLDEETHSLLDKATQYDKILYEHAKTLFLKQCKREKIQIS